MGGWAYRLKSLLDLFAILWFIVGNYLVFSPSDCSTYASLYYYTVMAWVVLGYALLLVPIAICISAIFCLPVVLVGMRAFNINVSTLAEGGTKEDLERIPVFKFQSTEEGQNELPDPTEADIKPKKRSGWIRKWMKDRHRSLKGQAAEIDPLSISKPEDAVCSICLSKYEHHDLLCKLW
ncbi:hypothetical protein BY458DRAFT_535708 [Sporodiniella umbellata]|nr:hypothetical protein BY458DRAFT_535708 [Sporodiniella umbellata]